MTSMQQNPGQGGLPPTRAQLFDLIGSMRVTQLIYVAAKLRIADQLKEGPKRIDELASTAAVDRNALYRVLRALASHGIFAETGDCHFALTPQAELLREDVPGSLRVGDAAGGGEPLETVGRAARVRADGGNGVQSGIRDGVVGVCGRASRRR